MFGMFGMFEISPQIFNNIQVWGLNDGLFQNLHPSFLEVQSMLILRYAWDHCLDGIPNFASTSMSGLTFETLASVLIFGGIHSSFHLQVFPVPPAATQPQSIMDPPPCLTVGKVFSTKASPFFLQNIPSLVVQKVQFWVSSPKHIVPKGFRREVIGKASFWQLCHVALCSFKACCIFVL